MNSPLSLDDNTGTTLDTGRERARASYVESIFGGGIDLIIWAHQEDLLRKAEEKQMFLQAVTSIKAKKKKRRRK